MHKLKLFAKTFAFNNYKFNKLLLSSSSTCEYNPNNYVRNSSFICQKRTKTTIRNVAIEDPLPQHPISIETESPLPSSQLPSSSSSSESILMSMTNAKKLITDYHVRQHLLKDFPFLLMASTLLPPPLSSSSSPLINESEQFFHDLSEKCSDDNFLSHLNSLLNNHCIRQQLIEKLRLICDYNPNFLRYLIYEQRDNLSIFCNQFKNANDLKLLENILSIFHQAYNQNLNGLIAMIIINTIHYSKNNFKHLFSDVCEQNSCDSFFAERSRMLAMCYDLINYGLESHNWIAINNRSNMSDYHKIDKKFINLLVLMGDHCLIKILSLSNIFENIVLTKSLINSQLFSVEGHYSCVATSVQSNINNVILFDDNNYIQNNLNEFRMKIFNNQNNDNDEILSKIMLESDWLTKSQLNHLLSYCYLTNSYQLQQSLSKMFMLYGLNDDAQKFAQEFGYNLGMAIKLFNLIINHSDKMINNRNETFSQIPNHLKQRLLTYFIDQSLHTLNKHLLSQPSSSSNEQMSDRSKITIGLFQQFIEQLKLTNEPMDELIKHKEML